MSWNIKQIEKVIKAKYIGKEKEERQRGIYLTVFKLRISVKRICFLYSNVYSSYIVFPWGYAVFFSF